MLGGDRIGKLERLRHSPRDDDSAVFFQRFESNRLPFGPAQLLFDGPLNLERRRHGRRHAQRRRQLIMLGLRQHIGGDIFGIGAVIHQQKNLTGSGDGVDIDFAENQSLGRRDEDISRTDDFIHFRDRRGAEGHRSDRLRAADTKNSIHAGNLGGGENNRAIIADGRGHNNFLHAGDFGGDRVHQYRRRIRRLAPWNVNADPFQRRDSLPEQHAYRVAILPALLQLAPMKRRDSPRRKTQGAQILCRNLSHRPFDLFWLHFHGRTSQTNMIEKLGVASQRAVACLLHCAENFSNFFLHFSFAAAAPLKNAGHQRFERRLACFDYPDPHSHSPILDS